MNKPARVLLLLPILIAILGILLNNLHGPYSFGSNFDPEYCYLLNALNILTLHTPGHTDHPGTTLQVIGAGVVFIKWLFGGSPKSLSDSIIAAPDTYLLAINLALNAIVAATAYLAGRRFYEVFGSLWAGVVLQLSFFLFLQPTIALTRVSPEPLLVAVGFSMAAALAPVFNSGAGRHDFSRVAIVSGLVLGAGVVTKITFAPWIVAVLLFPVLRDKLRFLAAAAISCVVLLVPVWPRLGAASSWFIALLTHEGRYGSGPVGAPSASTFLSNIRGQIRGEPLLFVALGAYAFLLVYAWARESEWITPQARRLLLACCLGIVLQTLMVAKHPAPHYILSILMAPALVNAVLVTRGVPLFGPRRAVAAGFVVLLAGGVLWNAARIKLWAGITEYHVAEVRRLTAKRRELRDCAVIGMYRSSAPGYALAFGNDYALGAQSANLEAEHADFVSFNIFSRQFVSFASQDRLAYVKDQLRQNHCLLLQGSRLAADLRGALSSFTLEEVAAGGDEVLYRLGLNPSAAAPLERSPSFGANAMVWEAEKFTAGDVVPDTSFWGAGIGVITSPKPPGRVEYRITAPAGTYEVSLRYASATARPLVLSINGKVVTTSAASEPTGGFNPGDQLWQKAASATLVAGENTIRLESSGPFPHVDKLALTPVPPR